MKRLLLALTVLLLAAAVAPAAERDDAESGTWLELSARARIVRGTTATLTQNLRWEDTFGRPMLIAPELSVRHRLKKWWRVEGGYRYLRERDNGGLFQHRHRAFANTRFRARTDAATFELRVQWQEEFRHELDDGTPERHALRTRAKASLRNLGAVTPFASVETTHRLDGADDDVPAGTLTKLRWALGAEWGRGPLEYSARYLLVVPLHEDTDPLTHVVSLGVRFDLPR